ncbi:MAG: YabP/YqfC family sporulation protein [Clostridiales bacterium]|jgi:hypothetical protein|nr:YabP/YqfC family sporulation protein [Clostridiales bacterium]
MSFYNEISKIFGGNGGDIVQGYNIVIADGNALYIDGLLRILEVGENSMRLLTKKVILNIEGTKLELVQSCGDTVVIKGDIIQVKVEK